MLSRLHERLLLIQQLRVIQMLTVVFVWANQSVDLFIVYITLSLFYELTLIEASRLTLKSPNKFVADDFLLFLFFISKELSLIVL